MSPPRKTRFNELQEVIEAQTTGSTCFLMSAGLSYRELVQSNLCLVQLLPKLIKFGHI